MEEKNIVRMVMIILFLSLSFVYWLYFFLNRDKQTPPHSSIPTGTTGITISPPSSLSEATITWNTWGKTSNQDIFNQLMRDRESQQGTWQSWMMSDDDFLISPPRFGTGSWTAMPGNTSTGWETGTGIDDIWSMIESMRQAMPSLSGTTPFLWPTLISQTLGIQAFASFKDDKFVDTFYLFLGNEEQSFSAQAQTLGGNTFRLATQADILANWLVGDDVVFINIPGITYEQNPTITRKVVFMYLWYRGWARLIQTPFETRPRFKPHLVSMYSEL